MGRRIAPYRHVHLERVREPSSPTEWKVSHLSLTCNGGGLIQLELLMRQSSTTKDFSPVPRPFNSTDAGTVSLAHIAFPFFFKKKPLPTRSLTVPWSPGPLVHFLHFLLQVRAGLLDGDVKAASKNKQEEDEHVGGTTSRDVDDVQLRCISRQDLIPYSHLRHPVWVFDFHNKCMYWANKAALILWNAKTLEELLERDFASDMSEATERRLFSYLESITNGETISDEWTIMPQGKPVTLTVHISGVRARDEDGRLLMFKEGEYIKVRDEIDQTALRRVEILRHLPLAVVQFDLVGNVMEQNPEASELFGGTNSTGPTLLERFVDQGVGQEFFSAILRLERGQNDSSASTEDYCQSLHAQLKTRSGQEKWFAIKAGQRKDPVTGNTVIIYSASASASAASAASNHAASNKIVKKEEVEMGEAADPEAPVKKNCRQDLEEENDRAIVGLKSRTTNHPDTDDDDVELGIAVAMTPATGSDHHETPLPASVAAGSSEYDSSTAGAWCIQGPGSSVGGEERSSSRGGLNNTGMAATGNSSTASFCTSIFEDYSDFDMTTTMTDLERQSGGGDEHLLEATLVTDHHDQEQQGNTHKLNIPEAKIINDLSIWSKCIPKSQHEKRICFGVIGAVFMLVVIICTAIVCVRTLL